jgi:cysteine desulfurase
MSQSYLYLDHAATTPLDPEVFSAMEPWFREEFGNPSAPYTLGHRARRAVDDARGVVAQLLHCSPQEVIFTAGGTESDNLAIFGAARYVGTGSVLTSSIEHSAVLEPCNQLAKEGFTVRVLPVEPNGIIGPTVVRDAVVDDTVLVSVMLANNEIGTIQPVAEIVSAAKEKNPRTIVHTDACQGTGALELDVQKFGIDLLTLNASKIYGPKGAGLLYVKRGTKLKPLLYGGDQEHGLRPGTENVAAIVGLAKAMQLAEDRRVTESARITTLRNRLINGILHDIPHTRLNGDRERRLPNNASITIGGVDGE